MASRVAQALWWIAVPAVAMPIIAFASACTADTNAASRAPQPAAVVSTEPPPSPAGDFANDTGGALVTDRIFIAVLDGHGITYGSTTTAVIAGRSVCRALAQPFATFFDVVRQVEEQGGYKSHEDPTDAAGYITGAAVAAYCAHYESMVPGH